MKRVPGDGGLVFSWIASRQTPSAQFEHPITAYGVFRRQDEYKCQTGVADETADIPTGLAGEKLAGWDFLAYVPANGDDIYQYVAPTLCDSTSEGICWSVFFLRTLTPDPFTYYDTHPDSGYSVDNLVPGVPGGFKVDFAVEGNSLQWDENFDPDVQYYNVYRGDRDDCESVVGEPLISVAGTDWTDDLGGAPGDPWDYCYWITAVDFCGNESEPILWDESSVTGVNAPDTPRQYALHSCYPNPFNPSTKIRFDLPRSQHVRLTVHAVDGRRVTSLINEPRTAGRHEAIWNGCDDHGRQIP